MSSIVRRSAAVFILALAACQVPDVGPFVDASQQVRSGILRSGDAVRLEIQAIESLPGYPKPPEGQPRQSKAFDTLWKTRVQVGNAMVDYASSLHAIATAAESGRASGEKLASAVEALGKAAGFAPGATAATGIAADVVKMVSDQIALIRGTSAMQDSMEAADPAIQGIAAVLRQDLSDSDSILQLAVQQQLSSETIALADNLNFRKKLTDEQKKLYKVDPITREQETRLGEIDQQLKLADAWYLPYAKRQNEFRAQLRLERELIAKCGQAVDEWAQVHHRMTLALREGKGFSVDSLLGTAGEIRDLVRRIQNHE